MTDVGSKITSSLLVLLVPIAVLLLIAVLAGGLSLGVPELAVLLTLWVLGLIWVWRRR